MPSSIWEAVERTGGALWDMFDGIFISGTVGGRKPDFAFYQHILHETGTIPKHTLLVDDSRDNIVTGRCLGFTCILYDTFVNVHQTLRNLCGDPISRASEFLTSNAKRHHSFASASQIIHENICQLLIMEATNDPSLVDYPHYPAEYDLDTTSICWTVIPDVASHETKMKVMDRMLTYCNVDGIPLTYFDHNRQRRDHVVCTNVLSLFYAHDRGEELSKATSFIHSILQSGAYFGGATYYEGSEVFFYRDFLYLRMRDEKRNRIRRRLGKGGGNCEPRGAAHNFACYGRSWLGNRNVNIRNVSPSVRYGHGSFVGEINGTFIQSTLSRAYRVPMRCPCFSYEAPLLYTTGVESGNSWMGFGKEDVSISTLHRAYGLEIEALQLLLP
ncbi:hypothetical protein CVT25_000773 [Psilocybe cyanescens]|uniref:Uncharacterized protein n=1 Tax=Psilocybe cyanescens TaxID=93625 RepID=A0A409XAR8_PSICY|nr:hypothetical protein CVT25_000773 [Psilocybe cyanescens]